MTERVAAHQDPDTRLLSPQRQCRQQRPTFEEGLIGETRPLVVVSVPDGVESEPLENLPVADERRPRQVLITNDPESWRLRHVASEGDSVITRCVRGGRVTGWRGHRACHPATT